MDQPPTPPAEGQGPGAPDWGEMKSKVTSATGPDRLLMIASALFFVMTFLPWYRISVRGFGSLSENAWGVESLGILAALFGVATFVFSVAVLGGLVKQVTGTPLLMLLLAGGTAVFTILRFLIRPGGDAAASIELLSAGAVKITRGIGLWAGLVLAILMTVAAFQKYRAVAV